VRRLRILPAPGPAPTQILIKRRATTHSSLSTDAGATWVRHSRDGLLLLVHPGRLTLASRRRSQSGESGCDGSSRGECRFQVVAALGVREDQQPVVGPQFEIGIGLQGVAVAHEQRDPGVVADGQVAEGHPVRS
jgi:hypothetical protein